MVPGRQADRSPAAGCAKRACLQEIRPPITINTKRRAVKFEVGFKEGSPRYVESPTGQGVAFDGKLYFDAGIHADFRYKSTSKDYRERFTIAAWVYPESEQSGSIITKVSDGPAEVENNVRAEGYGLYFINGKIHFNMVFRWARIRCALKPKSHCRRASGATSRWSLTG